MAAGSRPDGGFDVLNYTADLDAVQAYLGVPWRGGGYGIGVAGDSRWAQVFNDGGGYPNAGADANSTSHVKTTHFLNWASALSGGSMTLRSNVAVSGLRSDQYMAYLDTLLSFKPRFVFVGAFVNDIGQYLTTGDTVATILARAKQIITKIRRAGAVPVLFTEPGSTTFNATAVKMTHQLNQGLFELLENDWGFFLFDWAGVVWDSSNTTTTAIVFKTGYSSDGTHYTPIGNYFTGKALATFMAPILQAYPDLVASASYVHANGGNELVNALMLSTTTSGLPTGFTGTMPTSFTGSRNNTAAVACQVVAAPDGVGNALKLTVTGAAVGERIEVHQDATLANFAAGNVCDEGLKMIINSGAENLYQGSLWPVLTGITNPPADLYNPVQAASAPLPSDLNGRKMTQRSVPFVLPTITYAGWQCRFYMALAGGFDVTIWNPHLRFRNAF